MTSQNWDNGFALRPMKDSDIESVHNLESSTSPHPWTKGIIRNCLNSGDRCWILERNKELAGYGVTMVAAAEGSLLNIAIALDYQGQGLGQKLLEFLVQDVKELKAEMFFLEVRVSNHKAIDLYLKNDFSEVGIRRNYYHSSNGREDAIVMMRDLTQH